MRILSSSSRFRLLALPALFVAVASGCGGASVVEDTLSDDPARLAAGAAPAVLKTVYVSDDDRVTLSVRFSSSVSSGERFMVEWILPDSTVYLRRPVGTRPGTGDSLVTSMSIRGEGPSRRPGTWRVRLSLAGDELLARRFEITAAPEVHVSSRSAVAAFGVTVCQRIGWADRGGTRHERRFPGRAAWVGKDDLRARGATYEGMLLLSTAAEECAPGVMTGRASGG
jgi:hypothetical protein